MRNAKASLALALAAGLVITVAPSVTAQDDAEMMECDLEGTTPVTLQLQWVTQAQFAGFFAARDKCFYADRGLDVTIQEADPHGHCTTRGRLAERRPGVHPFLGTQGPRAA